MFALCIESSHARGMGHFYRALNLAEGLAQAGLPYIFYLNDHAPSRQLLAESGVTHRIVHLENLTGNWEAALIRQDGITLWLNDRLDTDIRHTEKIKTANIPLVTFDDRGTGAALADLHIAALAFDAQEKLGGARLLRGADYLILNPQIRDHMRVRTRLASILVTLGGSDTYGVTVKAVRLLKEMKLTATVVIGAAFMHDEALKNELGVGFTRGYPLEPYQFLPPCRGKVRMGVEQCDDAISTPSLALPLQEGGDIVSNKLAGFVVKRNVPSLIEEFALHDLAITGGGITPFEANASGLPCVVIANELFEIPVGKELHRLGGSIFAGHHASLPSPLFKAGLPLEQMSRAGMENIGLQGTQRVIEALLELVK